MKIQSVNLNGEFTIIKKLVLMISQMIKTINNLFSFRKGKTTKKIIHRVIPLDNQSKTLQLWKKRNPLVLPIIKKIMMDR